MSGLLIIAVLFALLYVLMIRPQRAKAQAQQRLLADVEVGDEILTVGGIYGIVQELEPDEEGGDLVVEIADGIHVRIARRALATVVKPDDEDDDEEAGEEDDADEADGDEDAPTEVVDVNDEGESVNPGAAEDTAPPARS